MQVKYYLGVGASILLALLGLGVGTFVSFAFFEDSELWLRIVIALIIAFIDFSLIWYVILRPGQEKGLALQPSTGQISIGKETQFFSDVTEVHFEQKPSPHSENLKELGHILRIVTTKKETIIGLNGLSKVQKETLKESLPQFRNAKVTGSTVEEIQKYLS